jgi:hypothetical protein
MQLHYYRTEKLVPIFTLNLSSHATPHGCSLLKPNGDQNVFRSYVEHHHADTVTVTNVTINSERPSVLTPRCLKKHIARKKISYSRCVRRMAGAIGFISHSGGTHHHSPFTVVPVVNFTNNPVFDLYQAVPQLNSYQTFKPPVYPSNIYNLQQNRDHLILPQFDQSMASSSSAHHDQSHLKPLQIRRDEDAHQHHSPFDKPKSNNSFSKRDGWNSG